MRFRMIPAALGAAALTALASTLTAQTPEPPAMPAATPTAAAPRSPGAAPAPAPRTPPLPRATPTAAQAAAARELFKSLHLQGSIDNTATAMVESEIAHNPQLAPYRDVMLGWLHKYMTWDAMLPELTQLYAETYTEGEMKALAMFYSSPVGQKALTKTPELLSRTAAIGAKISQPHQAELNEQLTARREELRAKAAARTPGAGGTPPPAAAIPGGTTPAPAKTPKSR